MLDNKIDLEFNKDTGFYEKPLADGRSNRRKWQSSDEMIEAVIEYIDHCRQVKELANIAGLCGYHRITRDTFYQHQNYYPDAYKMARELLEDRVINGRNTAMSIFYLKNAFGYADKIEHVNDITVTDSRLADATIDQLQALLTDKDTKLLGD